MYECMHVCMYACMHAWYVHMYVCPGIHRRPCIWYKPLNSQEAQVKILARKSFFQELKKKRIAHVFEDEDHQHYVHPVESVGFAVVH